MSIYQNVAMAKVTPRPKDWVGALIELLIWHTIEHEDFKQTLPYNHKSKHTVVVELRYIVQLKYIVPEPLS